MNGIHEVGGSIPPGSTTFAAPPVTAADHGPGARPPAAAWFFDVVSPYSYLQIKAFDRLPPGLRIAPRPVLFAALLKHWGQLGPAEIAPKRQHTYRQCIWLAAQRGIPFKLPPGHPFNPLKVQRLLVALGAPIEAVATAFDVVFAEGRDPNQDAVWRDLCARLGVGDGDARAAAPEAKEGLRRNTDRAIALGIFGVPTFRVGEQNFWGHDALDMMLDYLGDPGLFSRGEMVRAATLPVAAARKTEA